LRSGLSRSLPLELRIARGRHLIEPGERYNAARFRLDAARAIEGIRAAGRLPVVVGGTGLYVRALLRGLDPGPPADMTLRARLEETARLEGPTALHERLEALDPARAARLHPNDRVRVIRAIEKHEQSPSEFVAPKHGTQWQPFLR